MNFFKQIVFAAQSVVDAVKWPSIEASVMRRLDDKIADVDEARGRVEAQEVELIRALGSSSDRKRQEELIDEILGLELELTLTKQKGEAAKALKERLKAPAKEEAKA